MISFIKKVDELDIIKFLEYLKTEGFKVIYVDVVDVSNDIIDYVIISPSKFTWDVCINKKYFKLTTDDVISLTISFDKIINNYKDKAVSVLDNPTNHIKNDNV